MSDQLTDFDGPDDPIDDLDCLLKAFSKAAVITGLIKPNDRPEDYYGSVEHQKDLCRRLGLNPDDYDPNDDSQALKWHNTFVNAQIHGVDASGSPLYEDDFRVLGQFTGYTT